jgi:hypothetical protein
MATLDAAIDAVQTYVPNTDLEFGFYLVDSEIIRVGQSQAVSGRGRSLTVIGTSAQRGIAGTTAAAHSDGATVTRIYDLDASTDDGGPGGDSGFIVSATDPGAVGAGVVWKKPDGSVWATRNGADNGWLATFAPISDAIGSDFADLSRAASSVDGLTTVASTAITNGTGNADGTAFIKANGSGGADASRTAITEGAGTAAAKTEATTQTGLADAQTSAISAGGSVNADRIAQTAGGDGNASAKTTVDAEGLGNADASVAVTATGGGDADAVTTVTADGNGSATTGATATSATGTAGMSVVADATSARLAFNGTTPIAIPEIEATTATPEAIVLILHALGLTKAPA